MAPGRFTKNTSYNWSKTKKNFHCNWSKLKKTFHLIKYLLTTFIFFCLSFQSVRVHMYVYLCAYMYVRTHWCIHICHILRHIGFSHPMIIFPVIIMIYRYVFIMESDNSHLTRYLYIMMNSALSFYKWRAVVCLYTILLFPVKCDSAKILHYLHFNISTPGAGVTKAKSV